MLPNVYIGSVEKTKELMWVSDGDDYFVWREISFCPGLYKIFDEILVNAADNKQRDKNTSSILIDINREENFISIYNNGAGAPLAVHKTYEVPVPTLIFGHMLTSSHYDDTEKKLSGGCNGFGAKLCNIYSSKFFVETGSSKCRKEFKQLWVENMSKAAKPKLTPFKGEDYTRITFYPDLTNRESLDADIVSLMSRRAYYVSRIDSNQSIYSFDLI